MNFFKNIYFKIVFSLSLGVGSAFLFYHFFYKKADQEEVLAVQEYTQLPQSVIDELVRIWEQGDTDALLSKGRLRCPQEITPVSAAQYEFTRCNPHFFECALENLKFFPELNKALKTERVSLKRSYQPLMFYSSKKRFTRFLFPNQLTIDQLPKKGLSIELFGKRGHSWPIVFSDTCSMIKLPERRYPFYAEDLSELSWDNQGREIYIDRFQVSYQDINEWVIAYEKDSRLLNSKREQWMDPATHLKLSEMKSYCHSYGKKLLSSHLFDAIAFMPSDQRLAFPDYLYLSWSSWSRDQSGSVFRDDISPTQALCQKAFTKDCVDKFPFEAFNTNSASWADVYQVMGGEVEVVSNKFKLQKNLILSSRYYERSSPYHQLTRKGSWDGEGFDSKNFETPGNIIPNGVAFRCYLEK